MADLGAVGVDLGGIQVTGDKPLTITIRAGGLLGNLLVGTPNVGTLLSGSVTLNSVVTARTVRVCVRTTGVPIRTITSGPDGNYAVSGLDPDTSLYVIGLPDPADQTNAVIVDGLQVS